MARYKPTTLTDAEIDAIVARHMAPYASVLPRRDARLLRRIARKELVGYIADRDARAKAEQPRTAASVRPVPANDNSLPPRRIK